MLNDLFIKLVSISSPSGDEKEIASFVKTELSSLGFETIIDKEGNVLSRSNGRGEPVLISSHLDTVQGSKKVRPVKSGETIKSSGDSILGADNKAAVAAILHALKTTKSAVNRNLELIFSTREETDGGVSGIDLSWVKSKVGISADAGKAIGTIISKTPFIEGFQIEVRGKSSHSSEPQYGVNALSIASSAISHFKWGQIDEISTANIGLIEGGSAVNITPDRILLVGEIRSYSKENLEKINRNLEKTFKTSARLLSGKVKLSYSFYCDGYNHEGNEVSYNLVRKVYKRLKIKESSIPDFGGSDANFFNAKGINVVDVGDGVYNPHTNEEFIRTKDLKKLSEIFTAYMTS